MQVVKRDGNLVNYDRNKIIVAIRKANIEVDDAERISMGDIEGIVAAIESRMKDETIQVEEIQDIIEQKLMAAGKFVLARNRCAALPHLHPAGTAHSRGVPCCGD